MPTHQRKLVIVGDCMVGKTCLLSRFYWGKFPEGYIYSVFELAEVDIKVDQSIVKLALWDSTVGEGKHDSLRPILYPDSHIIVLAFSIDRPTSLENVHEQWIEELRHFIPRVPFILVGCKKDLREDEQTLNDLARTHQRPTTFDEGLATALKIGAGQYLECSAKTGEGVTEIFEVAARAAMESIRHTGRKVGQSCVIC
ncbi:P-loop containing nucleoside triphosphate hydrolase protein [Flagelloscypha sp. PMI_526]|nr:P-loop containing nucleoside triphosphate hydrolase protein [Flagelloscypha sp. PMI_526]